VPERAPEGYDLLHFFSAGPESPMTAETRRPHRPIAVVLAVVIGSLAAGGCASSESNKWAQTAPAIAPARAEMDVAFVNRWNATAAVDDSVRVIE
jgi:hypothetical protein